MDRYTLDPKQLEMLMLKRGITISELARRSGISFVTVSRTVNGHSSPLISTICKLAEALECDPAEIIKRSGE